MLKVLSVRSSKWVLQISSFVVYQQFRRRDPVDADETEFMENVFDALCSASSEAPIKKLFLESEGPDLMVLMMKFVP